MAMIAGTGMTYSGDRKGPLAIADEIGLDVVLQGLEQFHRQYGERFRPARLLRTKVRAGHLGVKTRRGFNEYRAERSDRWQSTRTSRSTIEDRVAVLTIDHPPANAFNKATVEDLERRSMSCWQTTRSR